MRLLKQKRYDRVPTYRKHTENQLTLQELADAAGVPLADEYQLEIDWVSKETAKFTQYAYQSSEMRRQALHDEERSPDGYLLQTPRQKGG